MRQMFGGEGQVVSFKVIVGDEGASIGEIIDSDNDDDMASDTDTDTDTDTQAPGQRIASLFESLTSRLGGDSMRALAHDTDEEEGGEGDA